MKRRFELLQAALFVLEGLNQSIDFSDQDLLVFDQLRKMLQFETGEDSSLWGSIGESINPIAERFRYDESEDSKSDKSIAFGLLLWIVMEVQAADNNDRLWLQSIRWMKSKIIPTNQLDLLGDFEGSTSELCAKVIDISYQEISKKDETGSNFITSLMLRPLIIWNTPGLSLKNRVDALCFELARPMPRLVMEESVGSLEWSLWHLIQKTIQTVVNELKNDKFEFIWPIPGVDKYSIPEMDERDPEIASTESMNGLIAEVKKLGYREGTLVVEKALVRVFRSMPDVNL